MQTIAGLVGLVALAGCGRVGFDERLGGDGAIDDSGGSSDGANVVGFSHLVAQGDSTCALYKGVAYCWGDNGAGQLGVASATTAPQPTPVNLPAGPITDLAIGATDGCAIVGDKLYCYGSLTSGAVSQITVTGSPTTVRCGDQFACVVAGSVLSCWGSSNGTGQLAVGDTNPRPSPTQTLVTTPITTLSLGQDHGCAISSGNAVCWGHNDFGTLGTGSNNPASSSTPVAVTPGNLSRQPYIAGWHACDLDMNTVACWGEGDNGENGDGLMTSYPAPHAVPGLSATVVAVGGGPTDRDASCAITTTGDVRCWGAGMFGRLGQGVAANSGVPVAVQGLPAGVAPVEIAIGYDHACAVLATGDAWCWGRGDKGQLGNGLSTNSLAPVKVVAPP